MKNLFFLFLFFSHIIIAQPAERLIKVIVAPDHVNWTYRVGEPVKFSIMVLQNGNPLKNAAVRYIVAPEKMTPIKKDSSFSNSGIITVDGGTMQTAGFMNCIATVSYNGKEYRGIGTAGFDPDKIKPTVEMPTDFNAFWDKAKADLAKIPLDARMTLMPERCTELVNVYHVNIQNYREGGGSSRLYGILSMPKKEGKYPALLHVPGAGARPYAGDVRSAEQGIITLQIGIHGLPVNLDVQLYNDLMAGAFKEYWTNNLDNRDKYYYKRVYLGCVRANDFLCSLPQYDGSNLAVTGGSQGGALSIVTAALDNRVKWWGGFYPALCDMVGYLQGRAGGWPHIFDKNNPHNNTPEKIKTAAYYDVVNFAKNVKIEGLCEMGYNDETCPPTSMFAAYNSITAPKSLDLYLETGHWTYPEEQEKMTAWLVKKLKGF